MNAILVDREEIKDLVKQAVAEALAESRSGCCQVPAAVSPQRNSRSKGVSSEDLDRLMGRAEFFRLLD